MDNENNNQMQPYQFEFESDSSGNWDFVIDKNLSEGSHILTVEDEHGNTDEALIYILKQEEQTDNSTSTVADKSNFGFIEKIGTNISPEISIITVWSLVFLVFIASLNIARLAKKADIEAFASPKQTKYFGINLIVAIILFLMALFAGFYFNYKLGYFQIVREKPALIINNFSGQLLDPLTFQGVKADIKAEDTIIKTSNSGYFVFSKVNFDEGLILTHPELKRSVNFLPLGKQKDQAIVWYFNPQMYNVLIEVLDNEARGKFEDIYNKIPETVKAKINSVDFVRNYKTNLAPNNIKDQEIVIKDTVIVDQWKSEKYDLLFDKVYAITVLNNKKSEIYYLINEAGEWKVLK